MELKGKIYLGIGGAGLVGLAITRKILEEKPKELHLTSLYEHEVISGIEKLKQLGHEIKDKGKLEWSCNNVKIYGKALNILPQEIKFNDTKYGELHDLIVKVKPDVIVNTTTMSTALAYAKYPNSSITPTRKLTWFMQTLYNAMLQADTKVYLKIGTMGTGGMGWNIPYSHGEGGNRPSTQLCEKNQMAFSETGILSLWSRYPKGPKIIELKIGSLIGFNTISNGKISWLHLPNLPAEVKENMKGKEIPIFKPVTFDLKNNKEKGKIDWSSKFIENLTGPYIITGENGQQTMHEFLSITRHDQMGMITAEEIADYVMLEMQGTETSYNYVITARPLPPTQFGGELRHIVRNTMIRMIEKDKNKKSNSPIYSNLGPKTAKLVAELALLKELGIDTIEKLASLDTNNLSKKIESFLTEEKNQLLLAKITSTGIPIILDDERIILGSTLSVPGVAVDSYDAIKNLLSKDKKQLNEIASLGWIDLRIKKQTVTIASPKGEIYTGLEAWKNRAQHILERAKKLHDKNFNELGTTLAENLLWKDFVTENGEIEIFPGEVAGWVLAHEEMGQRYVS